MKTLRLRHVRDSEPCRKAPPPQPSPRTRGEGGASGSLKSKKLAELRKLCARRAETVGRMAVITKADRHGAEQHLLRRHVDELADDAVHARPGFLRAGVQPVAAGEERQGVDVAAEIGPLAGAELAVDGDEQRHRRIEEFEIALVMRQPPREVVARDAE